MKKLVPVFLLCFVMSAGAQTLNLKYTNDIYFGAYKQDLIEVVIKKINDYYLNDVGGIITKIQKQKKLRLSKLEDRVAFLAQMESDVGAILKANNTWGLNETDPILKKYLLSVNALLGDEFVFPAVGKSNTGHNGQGYVTIGFHENELNYIYANMVTIKDNHISNGFPYTDFILGEFSRLIKKHFGEYTHERRLWSWSMCSTREEPVYYEKFNIRDGSIVGYVEAEFGVFTNRISKSQCTYRGNQLTTLSFYAFKSK